jgi:hypothetical protein
MSRLVKEIANHNGPGPTDPAFKQTVEEEEGPEAQDHTAKKTSCPVWIVKWTDGWEKFAPWPGHISSIKTGDAGEKIFDVIFFGDGSITYDLTEDEVFPFLPRFASYSQHPCKQKKLWEKSVIEAVDYILIRGGAGITAADLVGEKTRRFNDQRQKLVDNLPGILRWDFLSLISIFVEDDVILF